MIRVAVMYPNNEGASFDSNYYFNQHLPLVTDIFGDALKGSEIGIADRSKPKFADMPYFLVAQLLFETLDVFEEMFSAQAEVIQNDIKKFTNVSPIVQILEVV